MCVHTHHMPVRFNNFRPHPRCRCAYISYVSDITTAAISHVHLCMSCTCIRDMSWAARADCASNLQSLTSKHTLAEQRARCGTFLIYQHCLEHTRIMHYVLTMSLHAFLHMPKSVPYGHAMRRMPRSCKPLNIYVPYMDTCMHRYVQEAARNGAYTCTLYHA